MFGIVLTQFPLKKQLVKENKNQWGEEKKISVNASCSFIFTLFIYNILQIITVSHLSKWSGISNYITFCEDAVLLLQTQKI